MTINTTLYISAADASWDEGNLGNRTFTFDVTRAGHDEAASVAWSVSAGAVTASDFIGNGLPAGIINFLPGEYNKTISIQVAGDAAFEANEEFSVALASPSANAAIGRGSASGIIFNDDGAFISFALNPEALAEGNSGSIPVNFMVTRSGNTNIVASANWAVSGRPFTDAVASDFVGNVVPSGTVTFGVGETTKPIIVNVAGDMTIESDETLVVFLSNPSTDASIINPTSISRIINDDFDTTLSISTADVSWNEGNSGSTALNFVITRTGDTTGASSVKFAVTGSGANPANASDFAGGLLLSGNVTFAATETSKTIVVSVAGDETIEGDEGFTVTLSDPSGGAGLSSADITGTILNDDPAFIVVRDGISSFEMPTIYSGPVDFLQFQFLGSVAGDIVIGGSGNDFMNLLNGDDAADGGGGDDVLDGGTGSNFLTGGAGKDTFFLDGRGGSITWATITDFQPNEQVSIFGWRPGVSSVDWMMSDGAEGYKGATMHADLDGNGIIDTSVTFGGLDRSALPTPLIFEGLLWFT
jgi:Ca2+-binding RTX toxin-like protein